MAHETVIATRELAKHYRDVRAVDGLTLQVRRGEVYGFLGRNGAGKTTTIRMLPGLIGRRSRAAALPAALILDEPANALDPAGIVQVRELLRALARERGVTVFMSSHNLAEVAHPPIVSASFMRGGFWRSSTSARSRRTAAATSRCACPMSPAPERCLRSSLEPPESKSVTELYGFSEEPGLLSRGVAIGLALDLPGFSSDLLGRAARDVGLCAAMCCLLIPPVAWIATLGRGYLPGRSHDLEPRSVVRGEDTMEV